LLEAAVVAHMANCKYLAGVLRAAGEQGLAAVHNLVAVVLALAAVMRLLWRLAGLVPVLVPAVMQTLHTAALVVLAGFVVLCRLAFDSQRVPVQGYSRACQLPNVVYYRRTGIGHKLELLHGPEMRPSSSSQRRVQHPERETKDWLCRLF
jgi:hypothetical protein